LHRFDNSLAEAVSLFLSIYLAELQAQRQRGGSLTSARHSHMPPHSRRCDKVLRQEGSGAWANSIRDDYSGELLLVQMRDPIDHPTVATHLSCGHGMMLHGIDPEADAGPHTDSPSRYLATVATGGK
jgi:hypothetical protein